MIKKNSFAWLLCAISLASCAKHDPILPGERFDIFGSNDVSVQNRDVPQLSGTITNISGDSNCDYHQDERNTIWRGDKKVWSGFATNNPVKSNQAPICDGRFIYTGLSTGEVVKVDANSGRQIWSTDVFRANNLTGGASLVDIIAHVGLNDKYVYAGGLGDAFCKLKSSNGDTVWCQNISVGVDFIMVDDFIFVVGTDNNLYAINKNTGDVYWRSEVKKQVAPKYEKGVIVVGRQKIDYKNGVLK